MSSLPGLPGSPSPSPGADERTLEALSKASHSSINRNAFTLAIVAALVSGSCFGAMAVDYAARNTDIGYASSGLSDSVTGAFFLGGMLNALVSLIAFAHARTNAGFLVVLIIAAVSAGPVGSGVMTELLPSWWQIECTHDNARACYAVKRVADGIAADKRSCASSQWDERPCERLLERDKSNAAFYCSEWRAECAANPTSYGNSKCETANRRCPKPLDSTFDP